MKNGKGFLALVLLMIIITTGASKYGCFATKENPTTKIQYELYENKKFGFTLQIPITWDGYYTIIENAEDYIKVNFLGKSKTSKNGLTMFFISNEKYIKNNGFTDGVKKIGTSNSINYYYFTSTDYPIGALFDVYTDPNFKDKEEKVLAQNDYLKAKQMEKDIDNILVTFKAK